MDTCRACALIVCHVSKMRPGLPRLDVGVGLDYGGGVANCYDKCCLRTILLDLVLVRY